MKIRFDNYRFPCKESPNKCNPVNWYYYLQGKLRYWLYYSKLWDMLLREHIVEQIGWRINVMDIECYDKGACKLCGCSTTALQMANKACPKPCYPKMMGKKQWKEYKKENNIKVF